MVGILVTIENLLPRAPALSVDKTPSITRINNFRDTVNVVASRLKDAGEPHR